MLRRVERGPGQALGSVVVPGSILPVSLDRLVDRLGRMIRVVVAERKTGRTQWKPRLTNAEPSLPPRQRDPRDDEVDHTGLDILVGSELVEHLPQQPFPKSSLLGQPSRVRLKALGIRAVERTDRRSPPPQDLIASLERKNDIVRHCFHHRQPSPGRLPLLDDFVIVLVPRDHCLVVFNQMLPRPGQPFCSVAISSATQVTDRHCLIDTIHR